MTISQERVFKINKVIWTTMLRAIHVRISIPKQYQIMMSSVIGLNLLKLTSFLSIIPKLSQTTLYDNRITKPKVIHAQIPVPKWGKIKWEKFFWKQNGAIRGLQIGIGFRDYKSGQEKLQIGTALRISNRGRDFKSSQRDFKSRQRLQIWGEGDFYSGQRLQTGAE